MATTTKSGSDAPRRSIHPHARAGTPVVSHRIAYEPPVPAERVDVIEARAHGCLVLLERFERIGAGEAPRWLCGLYQSDETGPEGEMGDAAELGNLLLEEVLALHQALGAALADAGRRGLLAPVAPAVGAQEAP